MTTRTSPHPDTMTLGEARAWLRARLREGDRCPCCTQRAQIYRRAIGSAMSRTLIRAYRLHGTDWFHMPALTRGTVRGGDPAKLRYWHLIEEETTITRDDGGRAGWWRLTPLGVYFVQGEATVDRWALVYDGDFLRYEGAQVSIRDTLGKKFNLDELLSGIGS